MENQPEGPKQYDLTHYISPAPIHWKIRRVHDEANQSNGNCKRQCGHFRIKLKIHKHPIKEALLQIGARDFTVDDMLDTLTGILPQNDRDIVIERGKTERKRLVEELLVISGVYRVHRSAEDKKYQFNAARFYEEHSLPLHESFDALYSTLRSVKGIKTSGKVSNEKRSDSLEY